MAYTIAFLALSTHNDMQPSRPWPWVQYKYKITIKPAISTSYMPHLKATLVSLWQLFHVYVYNIGLLDWDLVQYRSYLNLSVYMWVSFLETWIWLLFSTPHKYLYLWSDTCRVIITLKWTLIFVKWYL